MKKWGSFLLSCFLLWSFLFPATAFAEAEENFDVKISVLSEKEVYEKEFLVEVQVMFYNQDFYHDGIFLSYHTFCENENGTVDVIEFENQRVKVVLDERGSAAVILQMVFKELKKGEYIEFDLVDESNAFWFSYNNAIKFKTDRIELFDRPVYKHIVRLREAIESETVMFTINFIVFTGIIGIYAYVRKKRIFEW